MAGPKPLSGVTIDDLLGVALSVGASRLDLTPGHAPTVLLGSAPFPLTGYEKIKPEDYERLVTDILTDSQQAAVFRDNGEVLFGYGLEKRAYFDVSVTGRTGARFLTRP